MFIPNCTISIKTNGRHNKIIRFMSKSTVPQFCSLSLGSIMIKFGRKKQINRTLIQNSFLIFGGFSYNPVSSIAKFDLKSRMWTKLGDLVQKRRSHGAIVSGLKSKKFTTDQLQQMYLSCPILSYQISGQVPQLSDFFPQKKKDKSDRRKSLSDKQRT